MDAGHHPFGALLVAPDHATVLMEQGNVDSVNHAEAVLAREAARRFAAGRALALHPGDDGRALRDVRRHPVLGEHRPGRVRHRGAGAALPHRRHAENPTLDLPCRHVFARGQKDVQVIGPVRGRRRGDHRPAPALLALDVAAAERAALGRLVPGRRIGRPRGRGLALEQHADDGAELELQMLPGGSRARVLDVRRQGEGANVANRRSAAPPGSGPGRTTASRRRRCAGTTCPTRTAGPLRRSRSDGACRASAAASGRASDAG